MKLAAYKPMAKKKTTKKAARPKAAKKRPAKKVARQASATVTTPAAPTEEAFPADLEAVPPDGVMAADQVDAMPAEAQAQHEVEQAVEETGAGLPAVEAQATQAGGLGGLAVLRELIWLIGPARRPRSAIVGRALSDGAAVSDAAAMTYMRIAERIRDSGLHHLREEVRVALAAYDADPRGHSRTLRGLFESAVNTLGEIHVVQLARRWGMFLVGDGPAIFEGWPEWDRPDEESPSLRRPGRRDDLSPTPREVIPATPGTEAPRRLTLVGDGSAPPPPRPSPSGPRRLILPDDDPPAGSTGGSSGAGP